MADGTEVVPEAVRDFGTSTFEQMSRFHDSLDSAVMPVMAANLGASGMSEARAAAAEHAEAAQSALLFTTDVANGLLALTYTSATVAQNYEQGDTSQQAQMASVQSSFSPPAGSVTIASEQAAAQAAAEREQARLAVLARRTGEDLTPEPTWAAGPAPVSSTAAAGRPNPYTEAFDDVQQHRADIADINGDDDPQDSSLVRDETYSPETERDDLQQQADALNQQSDSSTSYSGYAGGVHWDVETDQYGNSELVPTVTPQPGAGS